MVESIKKLLSEMGIHQYKLVEYITKQTIKKCIYGCQPEEMLKDIIFYKLFFEKDDHIFRIDFSYINCRDLKDIICKMINQGAWYCDYTEQFFAEVEITPQIVEVSCLENSVMDELFEIYPNILQMQHNFTEIKIGCSNANYYCQHIYVESVFNLLIHLIPNCPAHEIVINNVKNIEDIMDQIERELFFLKEQKSVCKCPSFCNSDEIIISPKITNTIVSFLCNLLQGEQIIFGSSYFTPSSFNTKIFKNNLSLYRDNYNDVLDGEGQITTSKYYIKEGILLSGFNDIRIASYLAQTAGDTVIIADELRAILNFNNVIISPCKKNTETELPLFDTIIGNQVYFNQTTGDLYMNLFSSSSGEAIVINEGIVDFFNKVECSVLYIDNADRKRDSYGLIVNLEKVNRNQRGGF